MIFTRSKDSHVQTVYTYQDLNFEILIEDPVTGEEVKEMTVKSKQRQSSADTSTAHMSDPAESTVSTSNSGPRKVVTSLAQAQTADASEEKAPQTGTRIQKS